MSTIRISHPNPHSVAEAKRRLAGPINTYCSIYGVQQRWEGDTLVLTGALANGRAVFRETSVDVELELGPGASSEKDRSDVTWGIEQAFAQQLRA